MRKIFRFIVLAALLLIAIQPAYGQSDAPKSSSRQAGRS